MLIKEAGLHAHTSSHIQVQAVVRGHHARTRFAEQRRAACLLQAHWRRLLAQRLVHKTQAVVTVQR
jgi:hypothetical protein